MRQLCLLLLVVTVTFCGPVSAGGVYSEDDEIAALKKELQELRTENRSLREENRSLREEIRELKSGSQRGDGVDPSAKDQIVGKVWEITATGRGGKRFGPARFLAHNGNIYVDSLDNAKIGTYTEKGPNVRIDVFNSSKTEVNGIYTLIQISKEPPTYTGNATNTKGVVFRVQLRMLND
ncbi:MAG: hypothetical protein JNL58_06635 [Planctomyces sp.]|nr:hypothetical protein [Planctomyces sp.]